MDRFLGIPSTPDQGDDFIGLPDMLSRQFAPLNVGPFDNAPARLIDQDISTVDPLAGIASPGGPIIPVQNVESDLMALRAELPFLPIFKPGFVPRTAWMPVANTPVDINVPSGAVLAIFAGNVDYFASFGGRATRPSATATDDETSSFYKAALEGRAWYVGGLKQIGLVSPSVNAVVQVLFWSRPNAAR